MPRNPINYSNTIIYKIICKDLTIQNIYVGHTTSFKDRKREHKSYCHNAKNKSYNCKIYKFIRENGGWENFDMVEIEKYPCQDSNEASARERYWFENLNAKLNSIYPQRTDKEYKEQHKEERKEYFKNYCKIKRNIPYNCYCGWIGNELEKYRHINSSFQHKVYIKK